MGVPALFRWLSQKYPKIISNVVEEQPREIEGETIPVDTRGVNPNGEEFDNLYLDMNGIVHPCSHPEDRPPPATEEEMMLEVFKYTERVVNMVRPRKLLMIAVDGVAPRAKMNQQRSRRFRSAKEAKEKDEEKAEFMKMLQSKSGGEIDEEVNETMNKKTWDSNAITPGTPFMDTLALSLRYWIAYKLNKDPAWEKLKIIISDATVPGEGEHKIMEFIRSQRRSPEHDPNTRHVIYGLDADLIMLGLATHEPHFRVLREDVFFQDSKARTCKICAQTGHRAEECQGKAKVKDGEFDEKQKGVQQKPFIWLHVSVLREYLEAELYVPNQPFPFDLERALDDWVFMCFFVGNDFLPHLPSLEIREQGIDTLIAIWRDNLPLMGGYVTKDGHVDLARVQYILSGLAKQEDAIFRRRKQTEDKREANAKRRKLEQESRNGRGFSRGNNGADVSPIDPNAPTNHPRGRKRHQEPPAAADDLPTFIPGQAQSAEVRALTHDMFVNRKALYKANEANKTAAVALKSQLLGKTTPGTDQVETEGESAAPSDGNPADQQGEPLPLVLGKRKAELLEDENGTPGRSTPTSSETAQADPSAPPPDSIRLWEDGYADRYYEQKFKADPKDIEFRHKVANAYVEGLCWVLLYYFQGCPSWTWYYPYHYAPFAQDFVNLENLKMDFVKGVPFKPYEQLMGVLPAASNHAIPEVFRPLMENEDSEIIDFYPAEFPIDLNGKKFAWQGVALLPFIDEKRLLKAMATKYPLLTPEENARNETGREVLLFSTRHPLYEEVAVNFYSKKQGAPTYNLNPRITEGLSGKVEKNESYLPQSTLYFPLPSGGMPDIEEDQSISVYFEMPSSTHVHKSMLLRGLQMPTPALDRTDIETVRSRASRTGRSFGGAPLRNDYDNNGPPNRNRGYRNGGHDGGGGRGQNNQINYANPFAAHLNPNFDPHALQRAPPPPHMAAAAGWMPPPPPGMNGFPPQPMNNNNYGYGGGYDANYQPPPQQFGRGFGGSGNDGYGGKHRGGRNGDRSGGRHGRGRYDRR